MSGRIAVLSGSGSPKGHRAVVGSVFVTMGRDSCASQALKYLMTFRRRSRRCSSPLDFQSIASRASRKLPSET
jgi:hypothetical protein